MDFENLLKIVAPSSNLVHISADGRKVRVFL